MATPDAAVCGGTKDAYYNFYHSQLRIWIECTFGMLTHRWAILRSAILMNVTVQKTVALVLALLAKLHHYCIDADGNSDLTYTASDEWQTDFNSTVPLIAAQDLQSTCEVVPEQLLGGGHHFDDIGGVNGLYKRQQRYNYMSATDGTPLPRDGLHSSQVASTGLSRPTPLP